MTDYPIGTALAHSAYHPTPFTRSAAPTPAQVRAMTSKQLPKILSTEEAKVDGVKWLKMEKINWKDEDGKEVSLLPASHSRPEPELMVDRGYGKQQTERHERAQ